VTQGDDERYYDQVLKEIRIQGLREGLWAKALAQTNGDEQAARGRYIALRVEQLVSADREAALEAKKTARSKKTHKAASALLLSVAREVVPFY
jgi:hypothetical protein